MIVLNILLVAAVVAGIYVRFGGKGPIVRRYLNAIAEAISKVSSETAQPSPTPAKPVASLPLKAPTPAAQPPSASSTPAPAVVAATPEPVVAATPAPAPAAPKPFDPADLAASPNAWPKKVRLKQAVIFSALYNGQVVGSVQADAGTPVDLVSIAGDQVTVSFNGSPQTLQWKLTDLEEEAVKRGWGVPAATPAPVPTPVIAAPPAATAPPAENAVPAAPAPAVESAVPAATPAPTENTTPAANPPATENVPPPSTENPPPPGQ